MSTCTETTPQLLHHYNPLFRKANLTIQDLEAPNTVQTLALPQQTRAINAAFLSVPSTLGERIKLRFDVECKVNWRGSRVYKRLRGSSVLVSCPNPEQAELFIQAMHDFAASLNGKWLAQRPQVSEKSGDGTTPGPKQAGGQE